MEKITTKIRGLVTFSVFAVLIGYSNLATAQTHREFLPLPATALPAQTPAEGYILQKEGANAYVVIAGFVQCSFIVTSKGVVVVDAPPSMVDKLQAAIKSVTSKPVTHVILTHDHFDHIGGCTNFAGAKLVGHAETAKLLQQFPDPKRPVPTITFPGEHYTLKVGDEKIELIYPGPNHETGNIIVYVPKAKLAIMTDLVMPGWVPYRGWGNADYIPGLFKAYDALLKLDFNTYVGGHVYRTGTRKDVEDSRSYLSDLWNETKKAMGNVPFKNAKEPANAWAAQAVWFEEVANVVTKILIEKWKDKLAGTDTFTHDTVVAAIISISTDAAVIQDNLTK